MKIIHLLLLLVFFIISCNEENPLLVNPPSKKESVKVRFINFANDKKLRTLDLEGATINDIAYATSSNAINPPSDSSFLKIYKNNQLEFEQELLVKYLRNTNYSFFALNKILCENSNECKIDTIITLRTSAAIPDDPKACLVRFFNAYPDTNYRYLVKFGCPNGEELFAPLNYLQYSFNPIILNQGEFSISLLKVDIQSPNKQIFVNLYNLKLIGKNQYTIIVNKLNEQENLSLLNENDLSNNSLTNLEVIKNRNTKLRTINLSKSNISLEKANYGSIFDNLNSNFIDKFRDISICDNISKDTLLLKSNGAITNKQAISLNTNNNYTLIVFDSSIADAKKSIIIENGLNRNLTNKSSIRVVNATLSLPQLTTALGARFEPKSNEFPFSYSSGIVLAEKQLFGDISNPIELNSGIIPINIFTSTEPAKLIFSTRAILEQNKNYILVILNDNDGKIKTFIVDDDDENNMINYLEEGIFIQVVNAYSKSDNVKVTFKSQSNNLELLRDAELNFSNSLATVIENKPLEIIVNNVSYQYNPETKKRGMIIVAGDDKGFKFLSNNFETNISNDFFRFRFVNATDMQFAKIKVNPNDEAFIESVEKDTFSSYRLEDRERKITYHIFNGDEEGYSLRISDVFFTLGKNYSIIMTGYPNNNCIRNFDKNKPNVIPNCYFVIIQQEF